MNSSNAPPAKDHSYAGGVFVLLLRVGAVFR